MKGRQTEKCESCVLSRALYRTEDPFADPCYACRLNWASRELLDGLRDEPRRSAGVALRDRTLDWFDALTESAALKRITWAVILFAALYFPAVYLVRHF